MTNVQFSFYSPCVYRMLVPVNSNAPMLPCPYVMCHHLLPFFSTRPFQPLLSLILRSALPATASL